MIDPNVELLHRQHAEALGRIDQLEREVTFYKTKLVGETQRLRLILHGLRLEVAQLEDWMALHTPKVLPPAPVSGDRRPAGVVIAAGIRAMERTRAAVLRLRTSLVDAVDDVTFEVATGQSRPQSDGRRDASQSGQASPPAEIPKAASEPTSSGAP